MMLVNAKDSELEFINWDETDSVVLLVEEGVELSHEGVSEDEVVKTCWEVLSHNCEDTLGV